MFKFSQNNFKVAILGSSKLPKSSQYYKDAELLGGLLSSENIMLVTGGGGIMEAVNNGAYKVNPGMSSGLSIKIKEEKINDFIGLNLNFMFDSIYPSIHSILNNSNICVFYPGGFGTFQELTTLLVGKKFNMFDDMDVILYGKNFWTPFVSLFEQKFLLEDALIEVHELSKIKILDDVHNVADYIIHRKIKK